MRVNNELLGTPTAELPDDHKKLGEWADEIANAPDPQSEIRAFISGACDLPEEEFDWVLNQVGFIMDDLEKETAEKHKEI